jgi:hypothetical protein
MWEGEMFSCCSYLPQMKLISECVWWKCITVSISYTLFIVWVVRFRSYLCFCLQGRKAEPNLIGPREWDSLTHWISVLKQPHSSRHIRLDPSFLPEDRSRSGFKTCFNYNICVGFEVLTAVAMKSSVFLDITACGPMTRTEAGSKQSLLFAFFSLVSGLAYS